MVTKRDLVIINRLACGGFDSFENKGGKVVAKAEIKLFSGTGEFTVEYTEGESKMYVVLHDGNRWIASWHISAPEEMNNRIVLERYVEAEVGKIIMRQYKQARVAIHETV